MPEFQILPPEEEPDERFRRLLSEVEDEMNSNTDDGHEASLKDLSGTPEKPSSPEESSLGEASQPEDDTNTLDREAADSGIRSSEPEAGDSTIPHPADDPQPPASPPVSPSSESKPKQQVFLDEEDTRPIRINPSSPTPPPPPFGKAFTPSPPALGTRGLPLPRRVDEIDVDATRVSPAAYTPPYQRRTYRPVEPPSLPPSLPPAAPPASEASYDWRRSLGCLLRTFIYGLFALVILTLCAGSIVVYQYFRIAQNLPNVAELRSKASQFETTRILDRNGNVLYEILDPNAGRRTYVPLSKISPYLVAATIATEDKDFYTHPGFDAFAILRAFWQNYQSGTTVSGASTITQQLARMLLFTPEERSQRTYQRKINEAILATEITRRYSKDEILELFLNENYYGNLSYGVEAAAETYFGTTADKLTLGQAAFLAGLPQAPSVYDVYTSRDLTLKRQEDVLVLMYEASQEQGCIYVSNAPQRVCLDPVSAANAASEMKSYNFHSPEIQMRYPHWVNYIRTLLESQYDPQTIYRSGFTVYTTLDPGLEDMAQKIVKQQVDSLAGLHVSDGALVAIRPSTGEILAMVGSADFYNEQISGQVNMAISPRQPGSSIKPVTYTAAFEKGWTPATLIWDVPSEFPPSGKADDPRPPYKPVNYDDRFHGPVTVRTALANSYNVPAVKTLNFVGIYDDPNTPVEDGFINLARRMGITTLNRPDYGLSLTLGGGDVTLLQLTGAYSIFANGGRRVPPVAITRILDHSGNVVYQYQPPAGDQVIRPEHAFLITSILSDNKARTPAFGPNSVLNLPFPAAAKTGTTNDFRDNWTMGYTPDIAVGVWVGNADYTPMQGTSGLTGAAPIWADFMKEAVQQITGGNPTPFSKPNGIVEKVICTISGTEPSQWCPEQRTEYFAADQPPLPKEDDLWQKVLVDTWTGLRASPACSDFTDEQFVLNVTDPSAIQWIKKDTQGRAWAESIGFSRPVTFAPSRDCTADDPRPTLSFTSPKEGDTINTSPLDIYGQADATKNFDYVQLEYGVGNDPVNWEPLDKRKNPVNKPDILYNWDLSEVPPGPVTLRLWMHSTQDTYAETRLHLNMQVPTPTPTPTPTETPTPTPTPTPTFTPTLTPTITPIATEPPLVPTAIGTPIVPIITLNPFP